MRHGKHEAGLALLQVAVNDLHNAGYALYHTAALAELPDALGRTGQIGSPLTVIDEALGQSTRTDERWCMAELLRVKSRNAFASSHANSHRAVRGSPSAIIGWARQCEALAWELRTGNSLCRLRYMQNQVAQGRDLLAPIYAQFTEGLHTSDLTTAKRLLER